MGNKNITPNQGTANTEKAVQKRMDIETKADVINPGDVKLVLPATKAGENKIRFQVMQNGKPKSKTLSVIQWTKKGNWARLSESQKLVLSRGKLASNIAKEQA